jgi:hypothetical protein
MEMDAVPAVDAMGKSAKTSPSVAMPTMTFERTYFPPT